MARYKFYIVLYCNYKVALGYFYVATQLTTTPEGRGPKTLHDRVRNGRTYCRVALVDNVMISCEFDEMRTIAGCSSNSISSLPVRIINVPPACGPNRGHTSPSNATTHQPRNIVLVLI